MTIKTDEGVIKFVGSAQFECRWEYNDHVISMILPTESKRKAADLVDRTGITVLFGGFDITNKYVELLDDKQDPKIRPTLENLQMICKLIDENMDDYIQSREG